MKTPQFLAIEDAVRVKCEVLVSGLAVADRLQALTSQANPKKVHLYDYGVAVPPFTVPDDLILYRPHGFNTKPVIVRVRYNPRSHWLLDARDGTPILINRRDNVVRIVELPMRSPLEDQELAGLPLGSGVQKLGYDLLGVVPSNVCFYFKQGKECRFCELQDTYLHHRPFPRAAKTAEYLGDALAAAAGADPSAVHVQTTPGNLRSYDVTPRLIADMVVRARQQLGSRPLHIAAAVMPPSDLSIINVLKDSGLDEVYFNVEVVRRDLFRAIAPGKADYGYEKFLSAFRHALAVFGEGAVYSNLVYGVQSLPVSLSTTGWKHERENEEMLAAVDALLRLRVLPVFTIYHFTGRNSIGPIPLEASGLLEFTRDYGRAIARSEIRPQHAEGVISFSLGSLPNTTYNDGMALAVCSQKASAHAA